MKAGDVLNGPDCFLRPVEVRINHPKQVPVHLRKERSRETEKQRSREMERHWTLEISAFSVSSLHLIPASLPLCISASKNLEHSRGGATGEKTDPFHPPSPAFDLPGADNFAFPPVRPLDQNIRTYFTNQTKRRRLRKEGDKVNCLKRSHHPKPVRLRIHRAARTFEAADRSV